MCMIMIYYNYKKWEPPPFPAPNVVFKFKFNSLRQPSLVNLTLYLGREKKGIGKLA